MKMIKKLAAVLTAAALVFGVTSCADVTEDENLELSISQNSTIVSIDYPDDYDGMEVTVVYNIGTEPSVDFKAETADILIGKKYTGPFSVSFDGAGSDSVTVYARAFYKNEETGKYSMGPLASKVITKNASQTVPSNYATTGTKEGLFEFRLSETGNSNTTHYFDTSSTNVFELDGTFTKVYYQIQFSWKGKGKGNWYLYMRDVNQGLIKGADGTTSFVATGSYTGSCFDASNGSVAAGALKLAGGTQDVIVNTTGTPHFYMNVNASTVSVSSGNISGTITIDGSAK